MWLTRIIIAIVISTGACVMAEVPPKRADVEATTLNPSGVSGEDLPNVEQGAPRNREVVLVALYEDAARTINRAAAKAIEEIGVKRNARFRLARAATLRAQIDKSIARLGVAGRAVVEPIARESYAMGLRQAVAQMREIGVADAVRLTGSRAAVAFTAVDDEAVNAIARDTVARMQNALADHGSRAVTVLRSVNADLSSLEPAINKTIARGILTGHPREADRALRRVIGGAAGLDAATSIRKLGAAQIEVGAWTGRIRDYVDIVTRTRTREATIMARHERLMDNGLDLVQITGRVSVNFCTRYIGLVVSLGDARDGFPSIHELPSDGPPFHPRCSKGTALFHAELSSSSRHTDNERARRAFEKNKAAGLLTTDLN